MTTETISTERLTKPARIKKIQTLTLVLLFLAGIVNFLDRSSLSVGCRQQNLAFCFPHFHFRTDWRNCLPAYCSIATAHDWC
jgi:hypothetical protein